MHSACAELSRKKFSLPPSKPTVAGPTCNLSRERKKLKLRIMQWQSSSNLQHLLIYSQAKRHHSSHRIPIPTHTPKCVCSPKCVNCPTLPATRSRFYAEWDIIHTGILPVNGNPMDKYNRDEVEHRRWWQLTWINTDMMSPIDVYVRNGTKIYQMNDESSNEHSQTKAAATNMIIRIGSCATVIVNIANDGPNARNVQPKNSGKVIFTFQYTAVAHRHKISHRTLKRARSI